MSTLNGPGKGMRSTRGARLAVGGFLIVLAVGFLVAQSIGVGDGFGDLVVAALTKVVLAPLAALIGALIAFWPTRDVELTLRSKIVFRSAVMVVAAATGAVLIWMSAATAISTGLLGAAALVLLRLVLAEQATRT